MTYWCGSVPLTNGSGFGSRSCYFRQWPSRRQQKTNFLTKFFLHITFWRYIYIMFPRFVQRKSQNSRNGGFLDYFCLTWEGSGSGSKPPSPRNMRFRWIRIRTFTLYRYCWVGTALLQTDDIVGRQWDIWYTCWTLLETVKFKTFRFWRFSRNSRD